jgi:hypothetical protein
MSAAKARICDEGRECLGCGKFLPWSEFDDSDRRGNVRGKKSHCRNCLARIREYFREYNRKRQSSRTFRNREEEHADVRRVLQEPIQLHPMQMRSLPVDKFVRSVNRFLNRDKHADQIPAPEETDS